MKGWELLPLSIALILLYAVLAGHLSLHFIVSGSMEPSAPVGSLVVAAPDIFLSPGEMVLYELEGRVVMHRVYRVESDGVVVVADAYPGYSELIAWDRIRGKALLVVPGLGFFAMGAAAMPALAAGLAVILAFYGRSSEEPSLFLPAALSLTLMAAIGDAGLISTGRTLAVIISLAMLTSLRVLELGAEGMARRLVNPGYLLLMISCLASISRKTLLGVFGL